MDFPFPTSTAPPYWINMTNTALLIIDMQNDFVVGNAHCKVDGAANALPVMRQALDFFRSRGLPVFHIIRSYEEDGSNAEITRQKDFQEGRKYIVAGSKGAEIVEELQPLPGEEVLIKPRFSAFFATGLAEILRRQGIDHAVVIGVNTANCVRATVFDAISHDFETTVIRDATASSTLKIAQDNIRDMQAIGVHCPSLEEFVLSVG
jgi:nicotinamidase-related amidase